MQRHPIPKDILASNPHARVCRACYMWLRRHYGMSTPKHLHCTTAHVTSHCADMLHQFEANGITFEALPAGSGGAERGASRKRPKPAPAMPPAPPSSSSSRSITASPARKLPRHGASPMAPRYDAVAAPWVPQGPAIAPPIQAANVYVPRDVYATPTATPRATYADAVDMYSGMPDRVKMMWGVDSPQQLARMNEAMDRSYNPVGLPSRRSDRSGSISSFELEGILSLSSFKSALTMDSAGWSLGSGSTPPNMPQRQASQLTVDSAAWSLGSGPAAATHPPIQSVFGTPAAAAPLPELDVDMDGDAIM